MSKTIRTLNLPAISGSQLEIPNDWVEPFTNIGFTIDKEVNVNEMHWKNNKFGIRIYNNTIQVVRWGTSTVVVQLTNNIGNTQNWTFVYMPYGEGILFSLVPTGTNTYLLSGILEPRHPGELDIAIGQNVIYMGNNTPASLPYCQGNFTGCYTSDLVLLTKVFDAGSNNFRDDIYYSVVNPQGFSFNSYRSTISGKDILLIKNLTTNPNICLLGFDMALVPEDEE